ncbi:NADH-FMN oxidoreductase RutF, flavin reductase (DIM6/NTAB) family [Paraburkholderia steynii]|uniref:NADH-FMN oxidoreductase RutF, flavin reductase (DIM6/NTAB) family n=1 Tax=Paraburkholderia steynii TaxID=1245441 RepID=A0A7Z7BC51_9BURK|nr:flavin reductase family protein [Paraburkholderia steynii]SDI49867.1 NADH-FMN oxidoreductase RutF, flavin reductase (DIM6/NTAB) family [Paraburkholderia steynii]
MTADLDLDITRFRAAMGKFATGVTVITFRHQGISAGMTANAFMSLSVAPPMILVSARRQSRFAQSVGIGERFGVSILSEDQQALSRHFGGQPQDGLADPYLLAGDVIVIRDALVQISARANAIHVGGDHLIYTADVETLTEGDGPPLLFFSGKYKQIFAHDPVQCWNDHG